MSTPNRKKSRRPYVTVLLVAGFSLFLMRNLLLGTPVETWKVTHAELRQSVVASGRVLWPQRVVVAAEITGRVAQIPVAEGQQVTRGQLLIQLEATDANAGLALAQTAVVQAEARLRQQQEVDLPLAQQALVQAQADSDELARQLVRLRELKNQNFVSQSQLDTATYNRDVARSKLDAARLRVQTNLPKGSDAALALAALEQARANLQSAQVAMQKSSIFAPAAGTLINRSAEPGDIVQPGKALMLLAVQGDTLLEVQIDEKNLAKLSLGQQALCSADAFSEQRFMAELVYINPGVDVMRGSVKVKLLVRDPPAYLRQDMTVSVDIETARHRDTLVMPVGALRSQSDKAPWVMVVRDGRTVHQAVTLGLRGDDNVEVLSGLEAGEPLIPATLGLIRVDQRVRSSQVTPP